MLPCSADFLKALKSPIKEAYLKFEFYDYKMNYINEYTKYVTKNDLGSISVDSNRSVTRNFSFALNNKKNEFTFGENQLVFLDKRLKLFIGLKLRNGTIEWIPQGVYLLTDLQDSHTKDGKITTISGQDKGYLFTGNRGKLKTQTTLEVGLNIGTAIKMLAGKVGETMFNFDTVTSTVPYALTYDAGSDLWSAITELADLAKCRVYYDVYGYLRLKNIDLNSFETEPSSWSYKYGDINEKFYAGNVRKLDESNLANHIVVYGGSGGTASSRYELIVTESNPLWKDSPYTIEKIGDLLYGHNDFNPDPLLDANSCLWRAKYELMKRLSYTERLTLNISPNYLHDINDVITIEDHENNLYGDKYLIESFSIPLKADIMQIECLRYRKVIENWNFI
ncbi:hypothetical protein F4V43_02595 [Paenibacillus spiritus]|uniref:DUF5048 domain-containing protein n=1 Tax=Paenibacillus spiritus TaxID=2496557 RepID=A0A5J5GGR1_9BACL|nr:hypothetical protein [Paenibacillus spiritus]KAA9007396.1 hypothetical protein F4V43_02595 [Paenibacillus spiritus]